jgi:nitroimidazol reductase NimA-like FMN-containing flavoprotein (pyridoxamine 5'-phosphate oxidase superfamily)
MKEQPMRRKDRAISPEECESILHKAEYGFLACTDGEGSPYAVPLSYVYREGVLYFHSAQEGKKIDILQRDSRVCFTVVGGTFPCFSGDFTTFFESVMVFGNASPVQDEQEKKAALHALCMKYVPNSKALIEASITKSHGRTAVYAIRPEIITGKAKRP